MLGHPFSHQHQKFQHHNPFYYPHILLPFRKSNRGVRQWISPVDTVFYLQAIVERFLWHTPVHFYE